MATPPEYIFGLERFRDRLLLAIQTEEARNRTDNRRVRSSLVAPKMVKRFARAQASTLNRSKLASKMWHKLDDILSILKHLRKGLLI